MVADEILESKTKPAKPLQCREDEGAMRIDERLDGEAVMVDDGGVVDAEISMVA